MHFFPLSDLFGDTIWQRQPARASLVEEKTLNVVPNE